MPEGPSGVADVRHRPRLPPNLGRFSRIVALEIEVPNVSKFGMEWMRSSTISDNATDS
jgi:hypothetical protein